MQVLQAVRNFLLDGYSGLQAGNSMREENRAAKEKSRSWSICWSSSRRTVNFVTSAQRVQARGSILAGFGEGQVRAPLLSGMAHHAGELKPSDSRQMSACARAATRKGEKKWRGEGG